MNEAWNIGVFFKMFSNAKTVFNEITVAAERANAALGMHEKAMKGVMTASGVAGKETSAYARAMNTAAAAADRLAVTERRTAAATDASAAAAMRARRAQGGRFSGVGETAGNVGTAVGVAALATTALGVKGAANLQDAMNQTQLASKMTDAQMERFHTLAMQMSASTAQSVGDSMGLIRTLATSGVNDPKELGALALPIARFADTQFLGKNHVAFDDSAAMAAKIAHMLGARTSKELTPVLDQLYKMSNDMPDSIKLASNQLKQFAPFFKQAGVSDQTILNLQATADRLGMGGGFGGTGLAQLLNVTRNPNKKAFKAQQKLGLIDANGGSRFIDRKTGSYDVLGEIRYVNQRRHEAEYKRDFDTNLQTAFQTQNARRVLAMFSSDAGLKQYQGVVNQQTGMADVEQAQVKLMGSLNNQTKLLYTNFQSLATELAMPWLQSITKPIHDFAEAVGNAAKWIHEHPTAGKAIGGVVGAAAGYSAYRLIHMGGGFIGAGMHMARHGPSMHIFGGTHGAAHAVSQAGRVTRLGGVGGLGRMGEGVAGMFSMGATRGIFGAIRAFAGDVGYLGASIFRTRAGFLLFSEIAVKLGLRMIPFVGEILLAIDTITFLGKHTGEIGKGIGAAAHWISKHGVPMLLDALRGGLVAMAEEIVDFFKGLFTGGFQNFIGNISKSMQDAWDAAEQDDHRSLVRQPMISANGMPSITLTGDHTHNYPPNTPPGDFFLKDIMKPGAMRTGGLGPLRTSAVNAH